VIAILIGFLFVLLFFLFYYAYTQFNEQMDYIFSNEDKILALNDTLKEFKRIDIDRMKAQICKLEMHYKFLKQQCDKENDEKENK